MYRAKLSTVLAIYLNIVYTVYLFHYYYGQLRGQVVEYPTANL